MTKIYINFDVDTRTLSNKQVAFLNNAILRTTSTYIITDNINFLVSDVEVSKTVYNICKRLKRNVEQFFDNANCDIFSKTNIFDTLNYSAEFIFDSFSLDIDTVDNSLTVNILLDEDAFI